jgi:hypothetical protein
MLSALALDADGLDPALHRTVLVHPDVPDTLHADAGHRVVRVGIPPAAVPVLRELHGVKPGHATKPGIAGLLSGLHAAEERLHRLVQATQRGLLAGKRPATLTLRGGRRSSWSAPGASRQSSTGTQPSSSRRSIRGWRWKCSTGCDAPLPDGWRRRSEVDKRGLAELIVAVSELIAARADIAEVELNPVRVTVDGPFAVDALVVEVS